MGKDHQTNKKLRHASLSSCQTCGDPVDLVSSRLECENCQALVHIACLQNKALPTSLLGDTFFVLVCKNCSTIPKIEVVKRDKVNWLSGRNVTDYYPIEILHTRYFKKLLIELY